VFEAGPASLYVVSRRLPVRSSTIQNLKNSVEVGTD